jgi:hypothetical protein
MDATSNSILVWPCTKASRTPDETQALQPPGAATSGAGVPAIFTAFQEQLGLRRKGRSGGEAFRKLGADPLHYCRGSIG